MKIFTSILLLSLAILLLSKVKVNAQAIIPIGTKWFYSKNNYGVTPPQTYPFTYECIRFEIKNNKKYR